MNDLSWFLYLAEVIPNIGVLFTALLFIGIVFGGGCMAGWTALWLDKNVDIKPWFGVYTSFLAVCALVSVLAPSKETIYLIAGSQAGEYVVNTPEAQEILTDIHQIIRLQLQQMQGEE